MHFLNNSNKFNPSQLMKFLKFTENNMLKNISQNGFALLGAGMLCITIASILERLTIYGSFIDFTIGLMHGIAVVAFGASIYFNTRNQIPVKNK